MDERRAVLTTDEARELAARWRPLFADQDAYVTSVQRYLDRIPPPNRNALDLDRWLARDVDLDGVRGALLAKPAEVEHAAQHLPDIVDDCETCRGKRLVRRDLPVGHVEFGKLLVCPTCNGRPTGRTIPPLEPEPDRCWKCRHTRAESAGEACTNPRWHDSNERLPPQSPVPGWKRLS